ncbi:hypothetical protein A2U01_0069788, partial [Trifolium medium]|nr:hypothetical protein [Trifolium medium]
MCVGQNSMVKRLEKCAGGERSLDSKVATEILFLERGTSINPLKNENIRSSRPNSGFGGRLCEGK